MKVVTDTVSKALGSIKLICFRCSGSIDPWIHRPLDLSTLGSIEPWIYRADPSWTVCDCFYVWMWNVQLSDTVTVFMCGMYMFLCMDVECTGCQTLWLFSYVECTCFYIWMWNVHVVRLCDCFHVRNVTTFMYELPCPFWLGNARLRSSQFVLPCEPRIEN